MIGEMNFPDFYFIDYRLLELHILVIIIIIIMIIMFIQAILKIELYSKTCKDDYYTK